MHRMTLAMRLHNHADVNRDPSEAAMAATIEVVSIVTDRFQATAPETARRALKLGNRD